MNARLARLLDDLEAAGDLDGSWRPIFEAVPRELFVPASAWFGDSPPVPISREDDPERWLDEVYKDQPIVTQMDEGRTPFGATGGSPTSSLSAPGVVARMLGLSLIVPGMTVLEIGTGSGWNAALLSAEIGDRNVYTVEVDPEVMAGARASLAAAGWAPTTVLGDGATRITGVPLVDYVMATCAAERVPYAWIEQTKPGGVILLPWRSTLFNGMLLELHVCDDGTASGNFIDTCSFMPLRAQVRTAPDVDTTGPAEERTTSLHARDVFDSFSVELAIAGLVRDCDRWVEWDDDVRVEHLDDFVTGSWAVARFDGGAGPYPLRQGGPRQLWDEVVAARLRWVSAGEPKFTRFGVTVTPSRQTLWLDEPENVLRVFDQE